MEDLSIAEFLEFPSSAFASHSPPVSVGAFWRSFVLTLLLTASTVGCSSLPSQATAGVAAPSLAATGASAAISPAATANGPIVSPYIDVQVTGVEIHFLSTRPAQAELAIQVVLPDQCKYRFYAVDNRQGQNIRVQIRAIHPPDNTCIQTAQTTEYVLALGRNLPMDQRGLAPGLYHLSINTFQTTFSVKE